MKEINVRPILALLMAVLLCASGTAAAQSSDGVVYLGGTAGYQGVTGFIESMDGLLGSSVEVSQTSFGAVGLAMFDLGYEDYLVGISGQYNKFGDVEISGPSGFSSQYSMSYSAIGVAIGAVSITDGFRGVGYFSLDFGRTKADISSNFADSGLVDPIDSSIFDGSGLGISAGYVQEFQEGFSWGIHGNYLFLENGDTLYEGGSGGPYSIVLSVGFML